MISEVTIEGCDCQCHSSESFCGQCCQNTHAGIHPSVNLFGRVVIGRGTKIGAFCDIGNVEIGSGCKIQAHVSISAGWKIGNNVFIGPGARMANDWHPSASNAHFKPLGGIVQDDVSIGMGALIGPGVRVGKGVMIGMGSIVLKDVDAGTTVVGNPARPISKSAESRTQ